MPIDSYSFQHSLMQLRTTCMKPAHQLYHVCVCVPVPWTWAWLLVFQICALSVGQVYVLCMMLICSTSLDEVSSKYIGDSLFAFPNEKLCSHGAGTVQYVRGLVVQGLSILLSHSLSQ